MSNWFKKESQEAPFDNPNEGVDMGLGQQPQVPQEPIRYRVMIPIDIWATPTGDQQTDQEAVYELLKGIINPGRSGAVRTEGFDDMLALSDIQTHDSVMKEHGL